MAEDDRGLAAFVAGLPDGQRHAGFFWAAMTAAEDGLGDREVEEIARAATGNGLDEQYVRRTIAEAREQAG
jgi:hypothetical protein